ncbi:hypothetical protein E8E12_001939 [Didymella heteroderae]|uniref:F-box domain-containing protein n=1 Tax=Didymella heteroderae TaxID=1769908 RepID=A0A9P4WQ26_9PLEO|nr:hypothetical protein E8E12_001939 [Didymella heteroderae]
MDENAARSSPHLRLTTNTLQPQIPTSPPARAFLDLPPEIRNLVYKWLFPTGASAAQLLARRSGGYIQMSDRYTLLETCRQIYNEASLLLRGQQRFVIKQPKTLFDLMDRGDCEIEEKIVANVIPDRRIDIRYDLDHCTVSSEGASMLHVSRDFRRRVAYYASIRLTAALSVTGDFRRLNRWALSGQDCIPDIDDESFDQTSRIKLLVPRISGGDEGVFIFDVVELIMATNDIFDFTHVRIVVRDEEDTTLEDDQNLQDVKTGLLLFVHSLIKKSLGSQCPKMWLRRDLRVAFADLEHTDGSVERVINKNADCSWERLIDYMTAADLVRYYQNIERVQPFGRGLTCVAQALADSFYQEI